MNSEHEKVLMTASVTELVMARFKLAGRRNLAIVVAAGLAGVMIWLHCNLYFYIIPLLAGFGAAGQHFHLKQINQELQRRKAEAETK